MTCSNIQTQGTGQRKLQFSDELAQQNHASSVRKFLMRTGYNYFLVMVECMTNALILREIFYVTNVIPAKDLKINKD
jgi:hypothetical protein